MIAILYPGRDTVKVVVSWTDASGKAVILQSGSGMAKTAVQVVVVVLAVLCPGCDMVKVVFVSCTVAPDEAVVPQHSSDMVKAVEGWTEEAAILVPHHGSDMVKVVEGWTEEAAILQSGSGTAVDVT